MANGLPTSAEVGTTGRPDRGDQPALRPATLKAVLRLGHQGFSVEGTGRKSASPGLQSCRIRVSASTRARILTKGISLRALG
jgi:hypothetical protein